MKICIMNNLYPPYARGGAEQVVFQTVQGLLSAGHEVVLLTTTPTDPHLVREDRLSIYRFRPWNIFFYTEAHRFGRIRRLAWHLVDMFHLGSARYVARILKSEKPDVVHTHNLMGIGFLVPMMIRRAGIRHVHTVHDVQLVEPSAMILKTKDDDWRYRGPHVVIYTIMMKWLLGSPNVVISPSQFLRDFYQRRGFFFYSSLVVVRNPLTVPLFSVRVRRSEHDDIFRFLYLGQVEEHKGVRLLIDAFRALADTFPGTAALCLVGDGSLLPTIASLVRDCPTITLRGRLDRNCLPAVFSKSDMTIVPSLCYENSPTVIFESFAFGVPVLASNIEGIAELIEEGRNGLTFVAGSEEDLTAKMRWCLTHRNNVIEMEDHTKMALIGLSRDDYIERLTALYWH